MSGERSTSSFRGPKQLCKCPPSNVDKGSGHWSDPNGSGGRGYEYDDGGGRSYLDSRDGGM